jgi:CRISPR type IV-associated protein Csf3
MKTHKITFNLAAPISFIDRPTFDGVLSYAYAREIMKDKPFVQKLNIEPDELIDFSPMPISQHKNGWFMASYMMWDEANAVEHTQHWRKRWANEKDEIADFGKNQRKVEINKGKFKSYDMPMRTVTIAAVWFYFQSENVAEVSRLVEKHIQFLGKKRAQGFGEVSSFVIEESEFDFSKVFRPIPAEFFTTDFQDINYKFAFCAWKPPYWLPANFAKCVV